MADLERDFERFWWAFPRRKAKGLARKAFTKAIQLTDIETICEGALNYARDNQFTDARFIKHPATWLNQECWDDEPDRDSFAAQDAADSRAILEVVFGLGGVDTVDGRSGDCDHDGAQISRGGIPDKFTASRERSESGGNQKVVAIRADKQDRGAG